MPRSHALLAGLFDYAGLFPPASVGLDQALANYARYRGSRHGWMLGRLIVPAAQLAACSEAGASYLPTGDGAFPWRLSALAAPDGEADVEQVRAFNRQHAEPSRGAAIVDTIELRVGSPDDVRGARAWASRGFEVFCEVEAGPTMERVLDAVARAGLHAKLRTGGVTPDAFPPADHVAAFLCACVTRGVVAKATAGLHHGISGEYPLTYEDGSPHGTMFGFLNLVLGAGIVEGAGRAAAQSVEVNATVARLLGVRGHPTWLGHSSIEWRGANGPIIEGPLEPFSVSGRALIRSIGTCSFEEPVEDARRIGLIS